MRTFWQTVLLALLCTAAVTRGATAEPYLGVFAEAGLAGAEDTGTTVLSLSGVLTWLNGSLDYVDPWSGDGHRSSAFRGYL